MKTVLGVLVVLAGGAFVAVIGDDAVGAALEVSAPGKVEAVTLYRGQALVTRVVPFEGKAGPVELTITDLPAAVQGESLFASGGKDVQVRAVRYRTRALSEAPQAATQRNAKLAFTVIATYICALKREVP